MSNSILSPGPPPLTQQAADAALDAIDFIAAAVRGVDTIDVTDALRPLWRAHLAAWYPLLPFATQQWYANAPLMLATIRAQWPLLDPWQRTALLQQWSFELPQLLWMLEPVLAQAYAEETRQTIAEQLAAMREQARSARPAATAPEVSAIEQLNNRAVIRSRERDISSRARARRVPRRQRFSPLPVEAVV